MYTNIYNTLPKIFHVCLTSSYLFMICLICTNCYCIYTSCIIRANKMSATVHQLDSNIPFQTMHKDLHAILIYSISG